MAEMRYDGDHDRHQTGRELIGARIRRARLEANLTQTQLGEAVGVAHPSTVSDWERGATNLTASQMIDVARVLGRPVAWFYGEATGRLAPAEIIDSVREAFPDQPGRTDAVIDILTGMFRQSSRIVREKQRVAGTPRRRENDHSRQTSTLVAALA